MLIRVCERRAVDSERAKRGRLFAPIALAGFTRLTLKIGQTTTLTLRLSRRAMQYWSTSDDTWHTATGTRPLTVSTDARTPALQTTINVQ